MKFAGICLAFLVLGSFGFGQSRLIDGDVVKDGEFTEVVALIRPAVDRAHCTGTFVGPRVIITHTRSCGLGNQPLKFFVGGKEYRAMMYKQVKANDQDTRPQLSDFSILMGIVDQDVPGVKPARIGKAPEMSLVTKMLGAGPFSKTATETDNKIRVATVQVVKVDNDKKMFTVGKAGGPFASMLGDTGGPVIYDEQGNHHLLGFIDGPSLDNTTNVRRVLAPEWESAFQRFMTEKNVKICGFQEEACAGGPPPPPPPPSDLACTLTASNSKVKVNERLTLFLTVTKGTATSASIDGGTVPLNPDGTALKDTFPSSPGVRTSSAKITNSAGKEATCQSASYEVIPKTIDPTDPPPTCTLVANPNDLYLGGQVTLTMTTSGKVTKATIDGVAVGITGGTVSKTPSEAKTYTSEGYVEGPGGPGTCQATYTVKKSGGSAAPTCTIVANPNVVSPGSAIVFTLVPNGNFIEAKINNVPVFGPDWSYTIAPSRLGKFDMVGYVSGPGGPNTCSVSYTVDTVGPSLDAPNLTVVPTYCGDNTLARTLSVKEVCLAVLKKDMTTKVLTFADALQITYDDGQNPPYKRVFPILHRKRIAPASPAQTNLQETFTVYSNYSEPSPAFPTFQQLHTVTQTLTKFAAAGSEVPTAMEGVAPGMWDPVNKRWGSDLAFKVDKFVAK